MNIFSEHEYNSLRSELITRLTIINKQVSTAIITSISSWAAGMALWIKYLGQVEIHANYTMTMGYIASFLFLVPVFYFIPLAVKSGENIQQIASISAYIRVFYDYVSIREKNNVTNWETSNNLLSTINVNRGKKSRMMRLYNEEYTVLSICSFILYLMCTILAYFDIQNYKSFKVIITYIIVHGILCFASIVAIYMIRKASGMKNSMMKNTESYVKRYIERAIELNIIESDERDNAMEALDATRYIDI